MFIIQWKLLQICLLISRSEKCEREAKLKTKNAAKKRFRLTSSGNVKFYPARLHGRSKVLNKKNLGGIYRSLKALLPNSTYLTPGLRHKPTPKDNNNKQRRKETKSFQVWEDVPSPVHPLLVVKRRRTINIE